MSGLALLQKKDASAGLLSGASKKRAKHRLTEVGMCFITNMPITGYDFLCQRRRIGEQAMFLEECFVKLGHQTSWA